MGCFFLFYRSLFSSVLGFLRFCLRTVISYSPYSTSRVLQFSILFSPLHFLFFPFLYLFKVQCFSHSIIFTFLISNHYICWNIFTFLMFIPIISLHIVLIAISSLMLTRFMKKPGVKCHNSHLRVRSKIEISPHADRRQVPYIHFEPIILFSGSVF